MALLFADCFATPARILEWVAISSSRRSSHLRDQTHISYLLHWQADSLPLAPHATLRGKASKGSCCCSSITKSFLTLCHPMNCSMLTFPVLHYFPAFTQIHVHWVGDAIQLSHSCIFPFSSHLQSFPASGSFPMSQLFASGGQSIGASASASVLPMSIQGWFPLGLTGLVSLQSKGLPRVFSSTTVQKHQFFDAQPF